MLDGFEEPGTWSAVYADRVHLVEQVLARGLLDGFDNRRLCAGQVGRDEEARHLQAALAAEQAGRGGTLLVRGEAGIGKSRRAEPEAAGQRGWISPIGPKPSCGVST